MIKNGINKYLIKETESILGASLAIKNNKSRCLLVSKKQKILGVVSEGDILNALIDGKSVFTNVREIYNKNLKYLSKEDLIKAFSLLKKYGISLVPVLTKSLKLKGVYTENYILKKIKFDDNINSNKIRVKKN